MLHHHQLLLLLLLGGCADAVAARGAARSFKCTERCAPKCTKAPAAALQEAVEFGGCFRIALGAGVGVGGGG